MFCLRSSVSGRWNWGVGISWDVGSWLDISWRGLWDGENACIDGWWRAEEVRVDGVACARAWGARVGWCQRVDRVEVDGRGRSE